MKKFEASLKAQVLSIVGKEVNIMRKPSNCIRVVLKSGKEYYSSVKEVESDYFVIKVTYTGGGEEKIVIRFSEVATFSLD